MMKSNEPQIPIRADIVAKEREVMTSRERIMKSVDHCEPDHVAKDLGATPSSGISAIAYNNLISYTKMDCQPAMIYDVVQQLAQIEQPVIDRFGIDVLDIGRVFNERPEDWKPFRLPGGGMGQIPVWFHPVEQPDGSYAVYQNGKMIARMPNGATFFDGTYVPYPEELPEDYGDLDEQMSMILWQAMVHSPWDHADIPGFWPELRRRAVEFRKNTDKALVIVCGCNLFEWGTFLRKFENFLCDIMLEPEGVERLLDELMVRHMRTLEKVCEYLGDVVDIIRFGDDLGMDLGPLMPPDKYRELFKPRHTVLNEYVHKHSTMKTFLHSCGSIYKVMPDLIEAGYDIINPVQITAHEMDPARLKREFGKDITFWGGGCDTRRVLNHGTPQEVRDHVKMLLDIFAPGGGFVFNPVHNIMPDVPPENILAMFDTVNSYR